MKVKGPGKTQGTSKTSKKGKASQSDASFDDFIAAGVSRAAPAAPTQSIAKVDALLAVQAAEDPTAGKKRQRMRQRATDILDELDGLRMAMLNGNMTVGHMVDIADVVASHRENISDPALTGILDEIDMRAQIELAKMRVALDKKAGA